MNPTKGAPQPAPSSPSASSIAASEVTIRLFRADDPIPEITSLLHRAYAAQVAMGLKPLAGRQDDATTLRRCSNGECYLALLPGEAAGSKDRIVGVILFHEVEPDQGPPWFQNTFVDSFSQFGVDPALQGKGIGRLLLDTVERRASECNATELALSMAEPDTGLRQFYERRGYRFIERWQWPYTNYVSLILSKTLGGSAGA